jgi:hypothetical protein
MVAAMRLSIVVMVDDVTVSRRDYALGDDIVVTLGCWYWYRSAADDMELRESVLADLNFGPVEDDELRALLAGDRRDYGGHRGD